ncbi:DUF2853 family protein [Luteococcus sp. H138]|uniref:DUF2853 family protein n=1 Tax=unclassified Luteococcus TaxID=2639923 RepID=UPI00313AB977
MDHLADIQKYSPKADADVVAAMAKTYRLVLSKPDSSMVSFSDPTELATVRENFVKKKLGVSGDDAALDAEIKKVGEQVPGRKNRLTVYYLLAEHYQKLDLFRV